MENQWILKTGVISMIRVEKLKGFGNVKIVEAEIPIPKDEEVLVKMKSSLISRGSELFRRYVLDDSVSHSMMGYSGSGNIAEIGSKITGLDKEQRVFVGGPHAEYVLGKIERGLFPLPESMSYQIATFIGLSTSALSWARSTPIKPGDDIVVLGQGIVGNLYSQAVREREPGRVITVDTIPLRIKASLKSGADMVLNESEGKIIEQVKDLTGGLGADVVVDCVGGPAGIKSFNQAQRMVKKDGVIHLIGAYQGGPNPGSGQLNLDSSFMMDKLLICGIRSSQPRKEHQADAVKMLDKGSIKVDHLITHSMLGVNTPDAYHLLYNHPDQALGVVLEWDQQ